MQNMVAVLPDRLSHDQRFIGRNAPEDLHAVLLAVNETMLFPRIERVRSLDRGALLFDCGDKLFFHFGLRRFTCLVRFKTKVTVRNEVEGFHDE